MDIIETIMVEVAGNNNGPVRINKCDLDPEIHNLPGIARIDKLIAAIKSLDQDDSSLWTDDGRPQVKAISPAVDGRVTTEERDEAWAKMNA